jgi:Holliday junction resolvase RusA-like endonuclease
MQFDNYEVRGLEPRPWGTKKQWGWRELIFKTLSSKKVSKEIYENKRFKVSVIFYLGKTQYGRTDLDNLAKPVLDTIFKVRYAQSRARKDGLTGALFDVDDDQVIELNLKKSQQDFLGIDIKIEYI